MAGVTQPFQQIDIPSKISITDTFLLRCSTDEATIEPDPVPDGTDEALLEGPERKILESIGLKVALLTYLDLADFEELVMRFIDCC